MIEYIILGVAAFVFLMVLLGVSATVLFRLIGSLASKGVSKVGQTIAAAPQAASNARMNLADLVAQHVAQAEAEKAAAKQKADLDARLAGLVGDPKDAPPSA